MSMTDSQRRAIETTDRDVLVISAPGSGKTTVLVRRIFHLLRNGYSASDLLVLTFTRAAAKQLRERLARLLQEDGEPRPARILNGLLCGTFHAVSFRILQQEGGCLGYDAGTITVVDPADADLLLKQCAHDLAWLVNDKWKGGMSWKKLDDYREAYYTGQLDGIVDSLGHPPEAVLTEYHSRLHQANAVDFGQILSQTRRLLRDHPDVLRRYQQRFRSVLVDEAQDCDTVQFDLHDFFAPPASIFCVLDTRQSIYGFRGARPDLIRERHPNATIIQMRENFRSGQRIVEAANSLMTHSTDGLAEPMECATGKPGQVSLFTGRSARICSEIGLLRQQGYSYGDICVLARRHDSLKRLAWKLTEANVPFHRVGAGFDVCGTDEFRAVHAAMRLAVNCRDNMAFLRLYPFMGLNSEQYAGTRLDAARWGKSHFQALIHREEGECGNDLWEICQFGGRLAEVMTIENADLPATIDGELQALLDSFSNWMPESARIAIGSFWVEHCAGMTWLEALEWYAGRDEQDDMTRGDVVTLATIHAYKGLEQNAVILIDANDGIIPGSRSMREEGGVEEERRAMYVAITRARERLVLHYRGFYDQNLDHKILPPSRFLAEAGVLGEVVPA